MMHMYNVFYFTITAHFGLLLSLQLSILIWVLLYALQILEICIFQQIVLKNNFKKKKVKMNKRRKSTHSQLSLQNN